MSIAARRYGLRNSRIRNDLLAGYEENLSAYPVVCGAGGLQSGLDYQAFFDSAMETPVEEKAQDIPKDDDYQLVHYVNVSFANIREQPSKQSKIIGGAGKGEHLVILEKGSTGLRLIWAVKRVGRHSPALHLD